MGQSDRTHVLTWFVDTATLTQQKYGRLNLGSIGSRLHRLNSRSTHARSRSTQAQSRSLMLESDVSGCSCSCSVSLAVPFLGPPRHLSSHTVCDEKNVKSTRPCWGSQFWDPPFKGLLELIHHRQQLADAVG